MYKLFLNTVLLALLTIYSISLHAQKTKSTIQTDTITIQGNCGQCKSRIEEAAYLKGVKNATWNKTNKVLTVVYNSSKTTLDKIELSIAKAGHDSRDHKSSDVDYNKLPSCCAYRTGACHHE